MYAVAGFDFDDPEIGIVTGLPLEIGLYSIVSRDRSREARTPASLAGRVRESSRRRPVKRRGAVEPVDADVDCSRVIVAMAHDDSLRAAAGAAPDIGLDPDFGFETHRRLRLTKRARRQS